MPQVTGGKKKAINVPALQGQIAHLEKEKADLSGKVKPLIST